MATAQDLLQQVLTELKNISGRVQSLESRINSLEGKKNSPAQTINTIPATRLQPAPTSASAAQNKDHDSSFESQLGVAWLGKIGIIAIAIGIMYLLNYSVRQSVFGLDSIGRIITGFICGLLLLALGDFFHTRYPQWSKEFTGGGLGLMYFAFFTATAIDGLLPFVAGIFFMGLVSVLAGYLSLRYEAKIIALFGLAGGYLAPVLLHVGSLHASQVLFYLFTLNLAVAGFAYARKWRELDLIALVVSSCYALSVWNDVSFVPYVSYIMLYFFLFLMTSIIYNFVHQRKSSQADLAVLVYNPIFTVASLYYLLGHYGWEDYRSLMMICFAFLYIALAYVVFQYNRKDVYLTYALTGLAAGLVAAAIAIQFDNHWMTLAWAVEATVMIWIGLQLASKGTRTYGLILSLLVLFRLWIFDAGTDAPAFFNANFWIKLVIIVLLYISAYGYRKYRQMLSSDERSIMHILVIVANIVTIIIVSQEISTYINSLNSLVPTKRNYYDQVYSKRYQVNNVAISIFWLLYAVAALIVGMAKKVRVMRLLALTLFLASIIKIVLYDLAGAEAIYRIISFIVLGIVLIFASYLYATHKDRIKHFIAVEEPDDLTLTIKKMSDEGKSDVTFSLLNGKKFQVTNTNLVKICLLVSRETGKTTFASQELVPIYKKYDKQFRSELNPADLAALKKYLYEFAMVGGSYEIS